MQGMDLGALPVLASRGLCSFTLRWGPAARDGHSRQPHCNGILSRSECLQIRMGTRALSPGAANFLCSFGQSN